MLTSLKTHLYDSGNTVFQWLSASFCDGGIVVVATRSAVRCAGEEIWSSVVVDGEV